MSRFDDISLKKPCVPSGAQSRTRGREAAAERFSVRQGGGHTRLGQADAGLVGAAQGGGEGKWRGGGEGGGHRGGAEEGVGGGDVGVGDNTGR